MVKEAGREIVITHTETGNTKSLVINERIAGNQQFNSMAASKRFRYKVYRAPAHYKWDNPLERKSRHVRIFKAYTQQWGRMEYRVVGTFFVESELSLFLVAFSHSIKFEVKGAVK